ncbi:transcriptional regulator [Streptomyces sp. ISL-94]|uniref:AfsR/SARP family transcriptional regulator n=1 Tax=Streptomyces sp. ISL-94 TaxID=2819190 RepID=UPI001BECB8DA|nr:transcriptional regulator [Streptomyces sp. ISL-94]MBT2481589.1 transcriptional regulator [Streptomyces sp. ISL-94]
MELRILGPIEALNDGRARSLGGMRPRTLLAALVIAGERGLAEHEIHQVLWGTAPPATVRAQVHTYISRLRKALGDAVELVRLPNGYELMSSGATVDYLEFGSLAARGRDVFAAGGMAQAANLFTAALGQWRGPALIGATEFLEASEAPRLEELRMSVMEEKAAADLALGRARRVVEELAPCVAQFPFREGLRSLLMTALSHCGRQAEAITVYHEGRSVLAEHLGVDPGDELNSTFQSLLAGTLIARPPLPGGADNAVRPEAVSSREEAYTALPADLVDFTGRHAELRRLREWLKPAPDGTSCAGPVVVTGLAGSGKTVLAVRAAYGIAPAYPDGRLFVRCRDASGYRRPPADIAGDLLRGLGEQVDPTAGSEERVWRLQARLTQSRCLVVLDDAADEAQVHALVPGSGQTQFLITGRPRFATLPRVRVMALGGLQPREAMDLLDGITTGVVGSKGDAGRLVRLCDGHPAAIRAVAAQLIAKPHWTPAHLADRLADPCRDTLGLLRVGELDVGATLLRSAAELPEGPRRALQRLALLQARRITVRVAAATLELPVSQTEDLLELLVDAHMLGVAGSAGEGGFVFELPGLLMCLLTADGVYGGARHLRTEVIRWQPEPNRAPRPGLPAVAGSRCV